MGITIKNVTNAALKITDSLSIPIIKAVIDPPEGVISASDYGDFIDELYTWTAGMVSTAGFYHGGVPGDLPDWYFIPAGNYTRGGSTGFKITYTIQDDAFSSTHYNRGVKNYHIYYDNIPIGNYDILNGYGAYEVNYAVLLVDDEGNLLTPSNPGGSFSGYTGMYVTYADTPIYEMYVPGDYVTFLVDESGTVFHGMDAGGFSLVNSGNIDEYIEREIDPNNTDPYHRTTDDVSKTGGGTGTFTDDDEDTPLPALPTISAVDTGLITLYNPSESQLQALGDYLWSPLFDLDTLKKLFGNPMDAILGLSIVPVTPATSGSSELKVGNVGTGITMPKISSQFVRVNCGTLNIKEYWGAYLDYSPYTKAELYLPFIGTHEINIDDIMDKNINVVYSIDILSGALFCHVTCDGKTIYNFIGQCSCPIPITGQDWSDTINGVLSIAGNIGSMVATGGATAPFGIASIASTAVNSLKPNIEKSGTLSGMGGMLGYRKPVLFLTRPRQAVPQNQNKYMGYPAFITRRLGSVHGYCEIEHIELGNIDATYEEYQEIYTLLEKGVIL